MILKTNLKGEFIKYSREFIGYSDVSSLILCGIKDNLGLSTELLNFGVDGSYYAYVIDDEVEIGGHYEKVSVFTDWLKIYDDDELVKTFISSVINIYRSGDKGVIIQLLS